MNRVITERHFSFFRFFGFSDFLEAEFYGDEAQKVEFQFREAKRRIREEHNGKVAKLVREKADLPWYRIFKKDEMNEKIKQEQKLANETGFEELCALGRLLQKHGFTKDHKAVTREDSITITIEKWEKA